MGREMCYSIKKARRRAVRTKKKAALRRGPARRKKTMLEAGLRGTATVAVTPANTARAMGSGTLEVFATPALAALAEQTCWQSVAPELEPGSGTVGAKLSLEHTAPTPGGDARHL